MSEVESIGVPERGDVRAARYSINAVANALAILKMLAGQEAVTINDAATAVSVSRSTAYRLMVTLEDSRLAERIPAGGYRVGPEAILWATRVLAQLDIREVAEPILRQVWRASGETVNLGLLRGSELVYGEVLASPARFRTSEEPGARIPLHAAAIGKAVGAYLEPDRVAGLLGDEPYPSFTRSTVTSWPELLAVLESVRAKGFATDLEEIEIGVACVGAPVFKDGRVIGAISVSAPRARMSAERIETLGAELREAAAELSSRLSTPARSA